MGQKCDAIIEFGTTSSRKHTLGINGLITRENESLLHGTPFVDFMISDHISLLLKLQIAKPLPTVKEISYRKLKSIDIGAFSKDLAESNVVQHPTNDLNKLVNDYNTTLRSILDKHAPIRKRQMVVRHHEPWFTDAIKAEKLRRKKLERTWRANRTTESREEFTRQRNHVSTIMHKARTGFYRSKIQENSGDQKTLFRMIKSLCGQDQDTPLPPHECVSTLAEEFGSFFISKIEDIRVKLDSSTEIRPELASDSINVDVNPLSEFKPLNDAEIRDLLMKSATKSCTLDPIPTSLLKDCIDTLLPVIGLIVNLSLRYGFFADDWKLAIILPLIKKLGLELIFKSFRPVSNLQFVSKVTEKAAGLQICGHVTENKLHYDMQSSYREGHSTETALLRVQNDVYGAMDQEEVVMLLLLDLSAAFDTLDIDILLSRLENRFRITGNVLRWIKSYLIGRKQSVCIKGASGCAISEPKVLKCGVPQGSVLGPVLFTAYTAPLGDIAKSHGVNMHCYADDTQPYLSFKPVSQMAEDAAVDKLSAFVHELRAWMLANKLKLNDDKTMFLLIGRPCKLEKVSLSTFKVGDAEIPKSNYATNLGSIWDTEMSMERHVNSICKSGFYQLRKIAHLRKYLDKQATETIVHAFVSSRIDYCNSLLNGLPKYLTDRIQRLQNAAIRMVCRLGKFDHVTSSYISLHWLPIKQRIEFKTLLLTFKAINGLAPQYISELLEKYSDEILDIFRKNLM